ncbi:adenine-specific methyltransferase EcoRI family protein, partial [Gordonia alkanivorans]
MSTSFNDTATDEGYGRGAGSVTAKSNSWLTAAKANKQDEFYTQLADIENELRNFRRHFVHGHEKVPTGGQVEVPAGGQIKVPT